MAGGASLRRAHLVGILAEASGRLLAGEHEIQRRRRVGRRASLRRAWNLSIWNGRRMIGCRWVGGGRTENLAAGSARAAAAPTQKV